jgi:hypothetical protein
VPHKQVPPDQILLVLGRFPERFSQGQLNKVLKLLVHVAANGVGKNSFLKNYNESVPASSPNSNYSLFLLGNELILSPS